jgi:hypothetical protein
MGLMRVEWRCGVKVHWWLVKSRCRGEGEGCVQLSESECTVVKTILYNKSTSAHTEKFGTQSIF